VIRRCAAFVNTHIKRLEAGGAKLKAGLTVADFFVLRASSLLPQAYIYLG
jgi:hypothetical protein